jgi:hypothetical protein
MQANLANDYLLQAYGKSGLRRLGIGLQKAIETPAISISLRATARAIQRATTATAPGAGGMKQRQSDT